MTTQQFAPDQAEYVIPTFTIGDRLRKARETTGLSQGDFAREIGVSKGTVANYENETTPAKRPALMMWSMRTRVPIEWLAEGKPTPPTGAEDGSLFRPAGSTVSPASTANSGWRSHSGAFGTLARPGTRRRSVAA